jgi:hypothetical protein
MLAGVGALVVQVCVLDRVDAISNFVLVLLGAIGTLPGLALYHILRLIFFRSSTTEDDIVAVEASAVESTVHAPIAYEYDVEITGCPCCGGEEFRKVRSHALLALQADRVCLDCGTRYALATPRWFGLIFLFIALLFLCFATGFFWAEHIAPGEWPLPLISLDLLAAICAMCGLIALGGAFRCLFGRATNKVIRARDRATE